MRPEWDILETDLQAQGFSITDIAIQDQNQLICIHLKQEFFLHSYYFYELNEYF